MHNAALTMAISKAWDNIREVAPDEWDKIMLSEIFENPECCEFLPSEEAIKELELSGEM